MKRSASEKKTSRSKSSSTSRVKARSLGSRSRKPRFVVCVNSGGLVDLELLKVHRVQHDAAEAKNGFMRVIDASGDDYLYPASYFRSVKAPTNLFALVKREA